MKARSHLFLSYARADDEAFVRRLRRDLEAAGLSVWWDREKMKSRGRSLHQEIRDAIWGAERVLAIIGPHAVASEYVRTEWDHARLFGRAIVPVLRLGDHGLVPTDLATLYCLDIRAERPYEEALEELRRVLGEEVPALGSVSRVPALPAHFVPRPREMIDLGRTVLADSRSSTVITSEQRTAALQGMGGVGKSALAAAFARANDTRRAFIDGIVWLTAGPQAGPAEVLDNLRQLGGLFDDDPAHYVDVQTGATWLAQALADKVCLVVIDDAWDLAQIAPFRDALGRRCRLLVTTRDAGLVARVGAREHRLGVLSRSAALRLLAEWCGVEPAELPDEAASVAEECGYLPLALEICGAMAAAGVPWNDLLEELRGANVEFIEHAHFPSLFKSLKVGVDALGAGEPEAARCYRRLAVFRDGEAVPEATVTTLWCSAENLRPAQARRTLALLANRALLTLHGDRPDRRITLHAMQRDYLLATTDDIGALHRELVEAYRQRCPRGWSSGPDDDYFLERLPWHLAEGGREDELRTLLLEIPWLERKLGNSGIDALLADLELIPEDRELRLVGDALRKSAHVVRSRPEELEAQLLAKLIPVGGRLRRLEPSRPALSGLRLRPRLPSLTSPGTDPSYTLAGHTDAVTLLTLTPDGRHLVSASADRTLRVWSLEDRELLHTLPETPYRLVATPDGERVISISNGGELRGWELDSGELLYTVDPEGTGTIRWHLATDGTRAVGAGEDGGLTYWDLAGGGQISALRGHTAAVTAFALAGDGRTGVSASLDRTLRVWDLQAGAELRRLRVTKAPVRVIALPADGGRAVTASEDGRVRVWDLATGRRVRTLPAAEEGVPESLMIDGERVLGKDRQTVTAWDLEGELLFSLEVGWSDRIVTSPDGHRAVGVEGSEVSVWGLTHGEELQSFTAGADDVHALALSVDGRRGLFGLEEGSLSIWDLERGERLAAVAAHSAPVVAVELAADDRLAVSASENGTIKIWSLERLATPESSDQPVSHRVSVTAVALAAEGRRGVSGHSDGSLALWDLEAGERLYTMQSADTGPIRQLACTPDSRKIVSVGPAPGGGGRGDAICVWDLEAGTVRYFTVDISDEADLVLAPDGRRALLLSGTDMTVWDVDHAVQLHHFEASRQGSRDQVAFLDESATTVAILSGDVVEVRDLETGSTIRRLTIPDPASERWKDEPERTIWLVPGGRRAVADALDGTLLVWDLEGCRQLHLLEGHDEPVAALRFAADGSRMVSASKDGTVRVWNLEGGAEEHRLSCSTERLLLTPGGRRALTISAFGQPTAWDLDRGARLSELAVYADEDALLRLSDDGEHAFVSSGGPELEVWSLAGGTQLASFTADGGWTAFEILPDGRSVFGGDRMGRVHLLRLEPREACALEFGPENPPRVRSIVAPAVDISWTAAFDGTLPDLVEEAIEAEELDKALICLHFAIRQSPEEPWPHSLRALVFEWQEDITGAILCWDRAISLASRAGSDAGPALAHRAALHQERGDHEAAVRDYEAALESCDDEWVLPDLADSYVALGAYDLAVQTLDRALVARPSDSEILESKVVALSGWAELDRRKWDDCLKVARQATRKDPESAVAHAVIGSALRRQAKWKEALLSLDTALNLDGGYARALEEKGKVLLAAGSLPQAEAVFMQLQGVSQSAALGVAGRVLVLREMGRDDDAASLSRSGREGSAPAWLDLARAFSDLEAWEDAKMAFREAIEAEPQSAEAHNELAWLLAGVLVEDLEDAKRRAALAVELARDDSIRANSLDTLGVACYHLGDLALARKNIERAHELRPRSLEIRRHLETLLQETKE